METTKKAESHYTLRHLIDVGDLIVYPDGIFEVCEVQVKDTMIGSEESGGPEEVYNFLLQDGKSTGFGTYDDTLPVFVRWVDEYGMPV